MNFAGLLSLSDSDDSDWQENGLVLVGDDEDSESESAADSQRPQKALVSQNAAQLLDKAGGGTLGKSAQRQDCGGLHYLRQRALWRSVARRPDTEPTTTLIGRHFYVYKFIGAYLGYNYVFH